MTDDKSEPTTEQPEEAAAHDEPPTKAGDLRAQLDATVGEIKTLGAEIAGQLESSAKGGFAEAKAAWKRLEPKLHEAENQLHGASDAASERLRGVFGELKKSLRSLREKLP